MKRFRIEWSATIHGTTHVQAENEDEVYDMTDDLDTSEINDTKDICIDYVEELEVEEGDA